MFKIQRAILLLTVALSSAAANIIPEQDTTSHPKIYSSNFKLSLSESGFPPITSYLGKYFFEEDHFPFTPEYTVVSNDLCQEGHKLIKMEHPDLFHICLYENEFPEGNHYKFHVNSTLIKRCDKEENCEDMEKCFTDVRTNNLQNVSDDTVGLSWQRQNKFITILFQYRNKIIKCYGSSPFGLNKIVLKGSNVEQVASKSWELSSILHLTQEPISLKSNLKVYALLGGCWTMTIYHGGDTHQFKTAHHVTSNGVSNWIIWNEISLCKKSKEDQFNITLNNVTECRDDQAVVMLIPHDDECEVQRQPSSTTLKPLGVNYNSSTTFSCPTVITNILSILFLCKCLHIRAF